ncbi:MAG: sugar ABC transporter permease [Propionibacteriaceae bacterium]|jgi:putative multiple sugar transport system permease protein|nr:sugar ABC transporter permease [Propionibacteriaceae bacterium]
MTVPRDAEPALIDDEAFLIPQPKGGSIWAYLLENVLRRNGILVAFIVIIVALSIWQNMFLSPSNLTNLVLQYSYILVLALGMLMVIVLAQIDLSVGSVVAFTGAVAAVLVVRMGLPWWVGVLAAILSGTLVGAWQGFWVAIVGIPGFVVTLGGQLIFRGLAQLTLNYVSLSPFGGAYYGISNGFIKGWFGGTSFDVFTVVVFAVAVVGYAVSAWRSRMARIKYQQSVAPLPLFVLQVVLVAAVALFFAWRISQNRGLPVILIILAVFIMVYGVVMARTSFGRGIYAIGGNLLAAQLSGVKTKAITFWTFVNMGFLAGVAGVIYSARMNSAQPAAGVGMELDAIAACFIGGASTTGGIGRIAGAMVGGLIMAVISNGMQLAGVSQGLQPVIKGLILTLAVAFDLWNKRRTSVAA